MSTVFDRQEDKVMMCLAFGIQDLENDELLEMWKALQELDCSTGLSGDSDEWSQERSVSCSLCQCRTPDIKSWKT
uniref:Uncharacterized protein n=1 Tax=Acrobeloides nanus TaxID=290746 RepID=A0A914EHZ4_9BILA